MNCLVKTVLMLSALVSIFLSLGHTKASLKGVLASNYIREMIEFLPPDLADRRRPEGRSRGGASRDNCPIINKQLPLTALVPTIAVVDTEIAHYSSELAWNLTTQERPSFWFYVPYNLDGRITLEFDLEDQNGEVIYRGQVAPRTHLAGTLKVSLPDASPALVEGTAYHWVLKIRCDGQVSVFVDGWIERVIAGDDLHAQLESRSLREQAIVYATNSIWQDSLNILGDLYSENSLDESSREDWINFLTSGGLGDIAEEPILGSFELSSTVQELE